MKSLTAWNGWVNELTGICERHHMPCRLPNGSPDPKFVSLVSVFQTYVPTEYHRYGSFARLSAAIMHAWQTQARNDMP